MAAEHRDLSSPSIRNLYDEEGDEGQQPPVPLPKGVYALASEEVSAYKYWREYNIPYKTLLSQDLRDMGEHYRTRNFVRSRSGDYRDAESTSLRKRLPLERPSAKSLTEWEELWLKSSSPKTGLEDEQNWRGVKVLGSGTYGNVGLWEYTGAKNIEHRRVAVKEAVHDMHLLDEEAVLLRKLSKSKSSHIIKFIAQGASSTPSASIAEDVGSEPDRIRNIYMEYCQNGSLEHLIRRRIKRDLPFSETSLWRLFDCLVDAVSVLERGNEISVQFYDNKVSTNWKHRKSFKQIVHFDIKPENILVGDSNMYHPTPILKLTDFGIAKRYPPKLHPKYKKDFEKKIFFDFKNKEYRTLGTKGYYAPEQFSSRWDFADWESSEERVAGVYGSATNIWGIGIIMFELLMLTRDGNIKMQVKPGIEHWDPISPRRNINGARPKGMTYGHKMTGMNEYSYALRDAIWECLYEVPAYRPNPEELKERVQKGFKESFKLDPVLEPLEDFELPEPLQDIYSDIVSAPPEFPNLDLQTRNSGSAEKSELRHLQSNIQPATNNRPFPPSNHSLPQELNIEALSPEQAQAQVQQYQQTQIPAQAQSQAADDSMPSAAPAKRPRAKRGKTNRQPSRFSGHGLRSNRQRVNYKM